jgi:hypothetical protein
MKDNHKHAFIGTYWKTQKLALADLLKKEENSGHKFGILEFPNGFLVISERQFDEANML